MTKVSQDEANDILTRASVKDPSKISKDEYDEISKIADDKALPQLLTATAALTSSDP